MTKDKPKISEDLVRQIFSYDPVTGIVTRAINRKRWKKGETAGALIGKYIILSINGVQRKSHRVAWLLFYGHWPAAEIDHINGNSLDNRIKNLRDVSRRENEINKHSAHSNNFSCGIRGGT